MFISILNVNTRLFSILLLTFSYRMATNSKEYNKKNYMKYRWSDAAIKDRARRVQARRNKWLAVGDPREVDHKDSNPRNNNPSNLQVISRYKNRKKWAMKANS